VQAKNLTTGTKTMKGIDLFCSSSASTAVTSSMHHRSTVRGRTKSYDQDGRKSQLCVPCSSQLPISPKPFYLEKHRKSSADKDDTRRKSCADVSDLYTNAAADASSRRYLLADAPFIEWISDSNKFTPMLPSQHHVQDKPMPIKRNHPPSLRSSSSARSKDQVFLFFSTFVLSLFLFFSKRIYIKKSYYFVLNENVGVTLLCSYCFTMTLGWSWFVFWNLQVVVLRVSLPCKACEGKVRKHISKMEGESGQSIVSFGVTK